MFVRKRILIVENVEMNRQFLRHVLTNAGYVTETVMSGQDALKRLEDEDFDIFFVDVNMPDLDGIKFIQSLHVMSGYESVPIIAVTKSNPDSLKEKGSKIGIVEWVRTPLSREKLLSMLRTMGLINKYHAQSLVSG